MEKEPNPNNVLLVTQQELLQACQGHDATRLPRLAPVLHAVYAIGSGGELPVELLTVLQVLLMEPREYEDFESSQLQLLGPSFHVRSRGQRLTVCLLSLLAQLKKRLPALELLREKDLRILKEARTHMSSLTYTIDSI